jgi:metal-responsive CopG/Arc/MetJ family transcriptional regulator
MTDSVVSVRMPSSLVQKLKSLSEKNHFMDVSEELRSVIKTKTSEYKDKLKVEQETKPGGIVRAKTGIAIQQKEMKTMEHKRQLELAKKEEGMKESAKQKQKLLTTLKQLIQEIEHDKYK